MKVYEVVEKSVSFSSGILELSAEQAASRAHLLNDLGDGLFEIRQPVQFKRGEVLGYDGVVDKSLLETIRESEKKTGAPSGKKKDRNKALEECRAAIENARAEAEDIVALAKEDAEQILAAARLEAADIVAAAKDPSLAGAAAGPPAGDADPETAA